MMIVSSIFLISCNNVDFPYFTFRYLPGDIKILKIGDCYVIAAILTRLVTEQSVILQQSWEKIYLTSIQQFSHFNSRPTSTDFGHVPF